MNTCAGDPGDEDENGDDTIELSLSFAAVLCAACGAAIGEQTCPACGGSAASAYKPDEITMLRRGVLLPLRDEAEELVAGFEALPPPRIPVTSRVLFSGLVEADLFQLLDDVFAFGSALSSLDLNDPESIRGPVFLLAEANLDALKRALRLCEELSGFASPPPGDGIAGLAARIGQQATRLYIASLAVVTAIDMAAARGAQTAMQAEYNGFEAGDDVAELIALMRTESATLDERASRALARDGVYVDAWGDLDVGRVFWAFRDAGDPFVAVGRRAAQYFGTLGIADLDDVDEHSAALMALPLLLVLSVDRPLVAHRLVHETHALVTRAANYDRGAVTGIANDATLDNRSVLRRTEEFGAMGAEHGDDSVAAAVARYQCLADEWSAYVRVFIALSDVAQQRGSIRPSLVAEDSVAEHLAAVSDHSAPALQTLAGAIDVDLCADVSEYAWDAESDELTNPTRGRRWNADAFEDRVADLVSALSGADAGYSVGIVGETLTDTTPSWLSDPDRDHGERVLARCVFGAVGAEVVAVDAGGQRTVVRPLGDDPRPVDLLTATAGLAAAFPETPRFDVVDEAGQSLVSISAAALANARQAGPMIDDLALVSAFTESLRARGEDHVGAATRVAASQAVLVAVDGLRALELSSGARDVYRSIAARAGYAAGYLAATPHRDKTLRKQLDRLTRLRAASAAAARGDAGADRRSTDLLRSIQMWGRARDGGDLPE